MKILKSFILSHTKIPGRRISIGKYQYIMETPILTVYFGHFEKVF